MTMDGGLAPLIRFATENKLLVLGVSIIAFFALMAVLAPFIAPYSPYAMDFPQYLRPSSEHLLGTDDLGRDIFSQLIWSARVSLLIGFLAATIVVFIGFSVGIIAGYKGGMLENLLLGLTDVFILIPGLPLMILVASYLGPSVWNVIFIVALLWWCGTARVVHSRAVQVKEMSFIESTKMMGFREAYIIFRHILSNVKEIFVARWCLSVASAMMAEAGLAFLGLGDPFEISWGGMITSAFNNGGFILNLWWWYIAPGLMISIVTGAFFLIGMKKRKTTAIWSD